MRVTESRGAQTWHRWSRSRSLRLLVMARAERAAARGASRALHDARVVDAPPEAVCIICLDRGDEPLHRNCSCRGPTAGFAHMSCLVQYVSSAAETNLDLWNECGTCKQRYFGATLLGLARARWERARGLPEEDEERMAAMNCLALALDDSGDFAAALPLFEELLAADRRMQGDLGDDTLGSLYNLVRLHLAMDNPSLALPLAEECLRGRRQTMGEEHAETLLAMNQLSSVHDEMGNYDEALPLARRVLEAQRRTLGDEHEHTLVSINLVAFILDNGMGDKEAALPLHEEELRVSRRLNGSEHPRTLDAIYNLGQIHCNLERYAEGLPLLREAVAGMRKVLGEGDPDTQQALRALAQKEAAAAAEPNLEEE
eukprot:COSAG04_NODE_2176_length_4624_cov_33.939445_5_plen_370_part_01